jgi:Na+/melibiose symporter-like transporter
METTRNFVAFLQSCITPVALISGVGLLLLTFTNRLGRTIDRTRQLITELDQPDVSNRSKIENQIRILFQRSKLLRNCIATMLIGVICSSLIIPVLFFMILFNVDLRVIGYLLFIISIILILISTIYFFKDVMVSLHALKLEAQDYLEND